LEKPSGKIQIGRHRHRLYDNVEICLEEIGYGGMDWIHVAQDSYQWQALVNFSRFYYENC
jgi:hypothetical protein